MTQRRFEHNGYTCVVTYSGEGLPNFLVDGVPIPSFVVRDDDVQHLDEDMEFWVEALKAYLDGKEA